MRPDRPAIGLLLLLIVSLIQKTLADAAVETPLPYGNLRHKPSPKGYVVHRCAAGVDIDGCLLDPCWSAAQATDDFVDIVGPTGPVPWLKTASKILWDDDNLYIAAELEDPRVFAYEMEHDSIIFHDNDFEVFIDPDGDNWMYYEVEVNARGQVWDLFLVRPYRNGGPAVMNWETIPPAVPTMTTGPSGWSPMKVAVQVRGELNDAWGSSGWTVEMALPWSLLKQAAGRAAPPAPGDRWRINFSRVHWNVTWDDDSQRYIKDPPDQPGYNFVWSPQWQVQMHQPETWGYLHFSSTPVGQVAAGRTPEAWSPDPTWPARSLLMDVYYAQTLCFQATRQFCKSLEEAGQYTDFSDVTTAVDIQTTKVSFVASVVVPLADGSFVVVMVDQLSRIVQTPATAAGQLSHFNPFDGSSYWAQPTAAAGMVEHAA